MRIVTSGRLFLSGHLLLCYEVSSFAVFVCLVVWLLFVVVGPSDVTIVFLTGQHLLCYEVSSFAVFVWLLLLLFVVCGTQ